MSDAHALPERSQSIGEEIANAVSHGVGLLLAYLTSTLYHALPMNRAKRVFRILDHGAIYLLIAGTYTPFTLGPLRGSWGWTLLGLVWGLALVGIVFKAVGGARFPILSTCLYIAMGWLVIVAIEPLRLHLPLSGFLWLLAGGISYMAGVAFFAPKRLRYGHFVWHLFVLTGTACHFAAVLWYVAV